MAATIDGVLASAGLSAFSEALMGAGANNVNALAALPEATLLSPEIGMRKLHVNKLLKALQAAGVEGTTGQPPMPPPPAASVMPLVPPTPNVCGPEAQAFLESAGLAAYAPKIAALFVRSAGGGSGPVSLNQLNSLRDEDLLAEDLVGMKKVQLVKMRRALLELNYTAPLSPQHSVALVETSASAPLPPPSQLPAVLPPPPAIIAASVAGAPPPNKPPMTVATVSAAPLARTPVESAVISPRVMPPASPILPEKQVSAALKGADALAYQVAEREASMREAAATQASDDAGASQAQASRDHAIAHANAHAAAMSSAAPAPPPPASAAGGGGANQNAFKARALAAAEAERKMREAARAVPPPPSPWSSTISAVTAGAAATSMHSVDKKGEEWRSVVAYAGLSAFEGGLVQAGVSSKGTLQRLVEEAQSYGDASTLIARVGLRKMQVKQLASSLANANSNTSALAASASAYPPPTMMPAMAPVSIAPASVAVGTATITPSFGAAARVVAATATTTSDASTSFQEPRAQAHAPQQQGFSPQRPSMSSGGNGKFEARGGSEPSPEELVAMGIDPGVAAKEARGLWSEVRMGAPLSEVEAAVAEAVAEGEHSAAMGQEIMRRVVQLEQEASKQRESRGAAPRSPLLRASSSHEISAADVRKLAPSAPPPTIAAMATTVASTQSSPAAQVLPVRKEDVILSTVGALGWSRSNLVVSSVDPYGQASSAGVRAGWEVTAVDGVSCFDGFDVDRLIQLAGNRGQATVRVSFLTKPPPPPATNAAFVAASRASIHRGAAGAASQQQQAPSSLTTTPVNVSAFGGKARSNGGAGSASGSDSAETKSEVGNSEYGGGRSCAACTYVNLGTSPDCAMCGTELPPTAAGASASAASGPRGRNDGSSSLSTPSPGAHGNGSRPTVRAALTNDSSLAIRNRRTNAMAGRGHKITEVEVYCPGESLGEVCLLVQLPGLAEPARIDVELPPGIEAGQELIVTLPAHVADALERSVQGSVPFGSLTAGSSTTNNATPVSERVRSLRKAAAKATGMRGVFSGKGKNDQHDSDEGSLRSPNSGLSQDTVEGTFASPRSGSQYSAPHVNGGGGGMPSSSNRRGSAPGAMMNLSNEMANEQGNGGGGGGGSQSMSGAERQVAAFFATAGLPTMFVPRLIEKFGLQSSSDAVGALSRLADDEALASVGMSKMQILRFNKAAPGAAGASSASYGGGGGASSGSCPPQPSPQLQQQRASTGGEERSFGPRMNGSGGGGGVKVSGIFARMMQPPPQAPPSQGTNGQRVQRETRAGGGNNGAGSAGRTPNVTNHALEGLSEEEQLEIALRASMAPSGGSSSAQNDAAEVAAAVAREEEQLQRQQQQQRNARSPMQGGPTNGRAMSPYQYIYETKPEEIAKATLQRLVALAPMLDKPTAISLLRAMAAISEEVDPRNEDFTVSNRIFNVSYYFIWSSVQAECQGNGSEGPNMVRELHTRIKPLVFTTQSFEEARPGIDAQVKAWRQNRRPTIGL